MKSQNNFFSSRNHRNCSPSELHGGSLFKTFNGYYAISMVGYFISTIRLLSAGNSQPGRRAFSVIIILKSHRIFSFLTDRMYFIRIQLCIVINLSYTNPMCYGAMA